MIPTKEQFEKRLSELKKQHEKLLRKKNKKQTKEFNGIYHRYKRPVLTAAHAPLHWRYDFNYESNSFLMQRIGVNATLNSGAIYLDGKYLLMVRTEGWDRKSYFAVAESPTGLTISAFGSARLRFPKPMSRIPMFMTCALRSTKMAGFTEYFVRREKIKVRPRVILRWQPPVVVLPAPKTW